MWYLRRKICLVEKYQISWQMWISLKFIHIFYVHYTYLIMHYMLFGYKISFLLYTLFSQNLVCPIYTQLHLAKMDKYQVCLVAAGFICSSKMGEGKKRRLDVKLWVKLTSRETSSLPDKLFHIFSWSQIVSYFLLPVKMGKILETLEQHKGGVGE